MQALETIGPSFTILHLDAHCLIIDKPAGLAVHPGPKTPHSLEDHLPALARRLGQKRLPVLMHRLDRDTSGCLLLARTAAATRALAHLIEARGLEKTYIARLEQCPQTASGTINAPLAKISSKAKGWRMIVDVKNGKAAITDWKIVEAENALISFCPKTGRTHQIRVHATLIGGAIVGDPIYGATPGPMRLHAHHLAFSHADGTRVNATAPIPPNWTECQKSSN
jgi:tRNA pseudouridine32 synthase/23S rRNA pseudouridine746 synthase